MTQQRTKLDLEVLYTMLTTRELRSFKYRYPSASECTLEFVNDDQKYICGPEDLGQLMDDVVERRRPRLFFVDNSTKIGTDIRIHNMS